MVLRYNVFLFYKHGNMAYICYPALRQLWEYVTMLYSFEQFWVQTWIGRHSQSLNELYFGLMSVFCKKILIVPLSTEVDLGIRWVKARQSKQITFSWERTKTGLKQTTYMNSRLICVVIAISLFTWQAWERCCSMYAGMLAVSMLPGKWNCPFNTGV